MENFSVNGSSSIKIQLRNEDKPKNRRGILHVLEVFQPLPGEAPVQP